MAGLELLGATRRGKERMTDKRKSAEVAELERWFSNAANNDEDWGGELSWLQIKWAKAAKVLREYKLLLRERERINIMHRGTIWCCVGLLLGVVVGVVIRNFYL